MLRLTLAQMRRSLPRLVAASIAIVLGSAFVTATLTAGDVITRGSYDQITASFGSADLVVQPDGGGLDDMLATARGTSGVASADPLVVGWATLESGRRTVQQNVLPVPSSERLGSLEVVEGRAPTSDDEIALPATSAERLGVGVGDTVQVAWTRWQVVSTTVDEEGGTATATRVDEEEPVTQRDDVRVVGVVTDPHGAWAGYGGAALAVTDAVVRWSGATTLDEVGGGAVLVETAQDVTTVRTALADATPDARVLTRDEAAAERIEQLTNGSNVLVMMVLGFAAVALLVAALVIANTFQVLVAQRTRMLALLRCVGARRGQLRTAVLTEAGILGLASGAIGVVLGLGLAQAALSVLSAAQEGVPLPTVITPTLQNVLVPVLVAVAVTVGAAFVPARAATRVPPVAALRPADAPTVRARPGRVRLVLSAILTVGGLALLLGGVAMARAGVGVEQMLPLAVGVLGGATSFVGLLVGAPLWIPRVVAAVARPVARTSTSARLATANTLRNPRRTAVTSSALVIGVTLVVMTSTGAESARASLAQEMDERTPVDVVVAANAGATLPASLADDVRSVEGVAGAAAAVTGVAENTSGTSAEAYVVDDAARGLLRDAATVEALADGRSVVPTWFSDDGTSVVADGDDAPLAVRTSAAQVALLTPEAGTVLLGDTATDAVLVRLADGADAGQVTQSVQDTVTELDVRVWSPAASRQGDERLIDVVLAVVIGLLGVAVVIALVGVTNTLSLSVIERRRESATLRAVGLSRRGLRWMLATEGMLIAGVGGLIGTGLGLVYGWAGAATVFGTTGDLRLHVPWAHVVTVLVVAVLAGLVASALPARSAARTPPVAALGVD